uniref:Secreted protein n=1 Tax=Pararge aegeria TaxID=116150 RepID=S4PZA9_9NEOP
MHVLALKYFFVVMLHTSTRGSIYCIFRVSDFIGYVFTSKLLTFKINKPKPTIYYLLKMTPICFVASH